MEHGMKNNGKVIMSVLAFIGMLVLIVIGVSLWFEYQNTTTTVEKITKKVRPVLERVLPVVEEVVDKSVEITSKGLKGARTRYKEALDKFDTQKEVYSQKLEEGKDTLLTFREAMTAAQDKDAEFAKVYTKWKEIELEVIQVHDKFATLVTCASIFFEELENKANTMTAEHLKAIIVDKIAKSRERYAARIVQCTKGIDRLSVVNVTVNNSMIALEIGFALEVLEAELDRIFQEIDVMIASIIKELNMLSQESKELLEIRLEPVT